MLWSQDCLPELNAEMERSRPLGAALFPSLVAVYKWNGKPKREVMCDGITDNGKEPGAK